MGTYTDIGAWRHTDRDIGNRERSSQGQHVIQYGDRVGLYKEMFKFKFKFKCFVCHIHEHVVKYTKKGLRSTLCKKKRKIRKCYLRCSWPETLYGARQITVGKRNGE